MALAPDDFEAFVIANTALASPPHVPELHLHLADEAHALWLKTEDELAGIGLPPPFWAFAWAGGQGLARHLLDRPETVRGRDVLDFASRRRNAAFYDQALAGRLLPWFETLSARGATVLVGDPGRAYLPKSGLQALASYQVPVTRALEDAEIKKTTVWRFA